MNVTIKRTINGQRVSARPVFKGGAQPAYWAAVVNEQSLLRPFASATEVFRFALNRLERRRSARV